jgi:hypothetical protein
LIEVNTATGGTRIGKKLHVITHRELANMTSSLLDMRFQHKLATWGFYCPCKGIWFSFACVITHHARHLFLDYTSL